MNNKSQDFSWLLSFKINWILAQTTFVKFILPNLQIVPFSITSHCGLVWPSAWVVHLETWPCGLQYFFDARRGCECQCSKSIYASIVQKSFYLWPNAFNHFQIVWFGGCSHSCKSGYGCGGGNNCGGNWWCNWCWCCRNRAAAAVV